MPVATYCDSSGGSNHYGAFVVAMAIIVGVAMALAAWVGMLSQPDHTNTKQYKHTPPNTNNKNTDIPTSTTTTTTITQNNKNIPNNHH